MRKLTLKQQAAMLETAMPDVINDFCCELWPQVFDSLAVQQKAFISRLCRHSNAEWETMFKAEIQPINGAHRRRYDRARRRYAVRFLWLKHSRTASIELPTDLLQEST